LISANRRLSERAADAKRGSLHVAALDKVSQVNPAGGIALRFAARRV
jgi:hypothetical protein